MSTKNNGKPKKKAGCLITILIFVLFAALAFGIYYVSFHKDVKTEGPFTYEVGRMINIKKFKIEKYATIVGADKSIGKNIEIPSEYDGALVVGIGKDVFNGWDIDSVKLPDMSNEYWGFTLNEGCFEGTNIETFTMCDNCKAETNCFKDCTSLREVTLGRFCEIGRGFENCPNITRVNVDSVETWCTSSFASNPGDEMLSVIKERENGTKYSILYINGVQTSRIDKIPEGMTELGYAIFREIECAPEMTVPEGVKDLDGVFNYCESVKTLILPSSIKKISEGDIGYLPNLEKIVFPDELEKISLRALSSCYSLKEVHIPAKVSFWPFQGKGFEKITVDENNKKLYAKDGCLVCSETLLCAYGGGEITVDGTVIDTINISSVYDIDVSKLILTEGVKHIEKGAISGCDRLSEVSIPSTVTKIGKEMFTNCPLLMTINYNGTKEQWQKLTDGKLDLHVYAKTPYTPDSVAVVCTDGEIVIDKTVAP